MTFKSSIASLATRLAGYRFDIEEGWSKDGAVFIGAPHTSNWDFAGSSVSCLLAGLGLAGRMGVICSVGVAHGSSDLAAVLGVSFL